MSASRLAEALQEHVGLRVEKDNESVFHCEEGFERAGIVVGPHFYRTSIDAHCYAMESLVVRVIQYFLREGREKPWREIVNAVLTFIFQ